jgi:hypothetical protein
VTADPWPDLPDFDPMTGPEPAAGWLTSPGHPAAGADLRTLPPRGRAKRAGAINSGRPGWCYLLHFAEPIGADRPRVAQAQHYVGWAARGRVAARVGDDLAGRGCALVRYALGLGIGAELVRVWPGDRNRERQLKQNSATRYCPVCSPRRGRVADARRCAAMLTRVLRQLGGRNG